MVLRAMLAAWWLCASRGLLVSRPEARWRGRECKSGFEIDDLEALEKAYLQGGRRPPPRLGRECASYRWTQDARRVHVEIPLPSAVPESDVSLVIDKDEFAMEVIYPTRDYSTREFSEIRGALGGDIWPERSEWRVESDETEGARVVVSIAKQVTSATYSEMWQSFLFGEEPAPTVRYSGICRSTGARFRQHRDTFHLELDLPGHVDTDCVRLDVSPTSWRLDVYLPSSEPLSRRADLAGRVVPDDTVWLLDRNETATTLFVTFAKQRTGLPGDAATNWWPGFSRPPPPPAVDSPAALDPDDEEGSD